MDLEYRRETRSPDPVGSSNLARAVRCPIGGRRFGDAHCIPPQYFGSERNVDLVSVR